MINKEALDKFALSIIDNPNSTFGSGSVADFAMKNYKALIAGAIGAYALSKIVPAVYNYAHTEKQEQSQALQNYLLKNIAMNTVRQESLEPKKDTYNYVF